MLRAFQWQRPDGTRSIETAQLHNPARRRGDVAACGGYTAATSPGDRALNSRFTRAERKIRGSIPGRLRRDWLCREPICHDRIPLAEGKNDRLPALAGDLVNRQVTVITALGTTLGALAAKAATTKIPIVFATGVDPVAAGLVASLNQPGGNATGVTILSAETEAKRLELLHELLPTATIMALLVNPTNPPLAEPTTEALQGAARKLALQLHVLRASTEREFDPAFASLIELRASALVIGGDQFFNSRMEQLAALALRHRIPAIYAFREFVAANSATNLVPFRRGNPDQFAGTSASGILMPISR